MTTNIMPRRRRLAGSAVALATMAVLVGAMLLVRTHLDIAIVALVLVVPVVLGVVIGGFLAGVVAVVVGFVAYDVLFIPPYGTLTVGRAEDWAALGVYVTVMLLVSRVVDLLWRAESRSRESQQATARLLDLSELLVGDRPIDELFAIVVSSVKDSFDLSAVTLLLPPIPRTGDVTAPPLQSVAAAGRAFEREELDRLVPSGGATSTVRAQPSPSTGLRTASEELEAIVLNVGERTVGLLGIAGAPLLPGRRDLLAAYANHIALAIERSALRDQALRVQVLEEVDRHRRHLFGAVSHDLRTPLSTIKASASALLDPSIVLGASDRAELASLIETQSDRLDRVVSNLMDVSRIQAGSIRLDVVPVGLDELVAGALEALGPAATGVAISIPDDPIVVAGDRTLLVETLVNLLENALRYAPEGVPVELAVSLETGGTAVAISVTDRGPGIPPSERDRVFGTFQKGADDTPNARGGSGLGLAIARAFIETHRGSIRIDDARPGTLVHVELPLATGGPSETEAQLGDHR